jgi:hypothetical protein
MPGRQTQRGQRGAAGDDGDGLRAQPRHRGSDQVQDRLDALKVQPRAPVMVRITLAWASCVLQANGAWRGSTR